MQEAKMPKREEPKGVLRILGSGPETSRDTPLLLSREPMRSADELRPLAKQIAANADLIRSFQENVGKDDEDRARNFIDEVRNYARSIDPALTYAEDAALALLLTEIFRNEAQTGGSV
jgi:hypothetical protein